jgi:transposase-like protein
MKRKRYSPELKAKVAVEAIHGLKTASEIARRYQVHPNLVGLWKRQALESLPELFSRKGDHSQEDQEQLVRELYQRIGQLEMELEWLKKNGDPFRSGRSGR